MKVIEQEKADKAKVNENKLKERIFQLQTAFENEREKLFKITNEMNKQYKTTQDEMLKDINKLKADVKDKTEKIGLFSLYEKIKFLYRKKRFKNETIND